MTQANSTLSSVISFSGFISVFLAVAMLTTGTINTVATKFQDVQVVKGIGDGPPTAFEHAFFQTACMFLGEFACMFVYQISKFSFLKKKEKSESVNPVEVSNEKSEEVNLNDLNLEEKPKKKYLNPLIFWIPALCDLGGTTLLNVGLFLTYASVYQMLRSALVVFNGMFAIMFLKSRLYPHHFAGIILIVIGTGIVGLSSILNADPDQVNVARNPTLGNILVIAAQVLAATQFVVEEKFLGQYDAAPLQVVGWEGFFGLCMSTCVLFVLYWIPGADNGRMEDAPYALAQMLSSWKLALAVFGSIVSIAFFNFFGISMTQRISSTTRSTIDSMRTFSVWLVSLALGWESFSVIQLVGFFVLVAGSFMYNEVIVMPYYNDWYKNNKENWLARKKQKTLEKEEEKRGLIAKVAYE